MELQLDAGLDRCRGLPPIPSPRVRELKPSFPSGFPFVGQEAPLGKVQWNEQGLLKSPLVNKTRRAPVSQSQAAAPQALGGPSWQVELHGHRQCWGAVPFLIVQEGTWQHSRLTHCW